MSTLVELCAFACFVVAGWMVSPVLGLVVAGVALLVISQALDGVKLVPVPKVLALLARVKLLSKTVNWRAAEAP